MMCHRAVLRAAACCAVWTASACFSYVHHERGANPNYRAPIDENRPHSDLRWSLWWNVAHVWQPVACTYADGSVHYVYDDPDPKCLKYLPICENGVGKTEVTLPFYAVPLAVLTLGIAMPAQLTIYCSVDSPAEPPSGPL